MENEDVDKEFALSLFGRGSELQVAGTGSRSGRRSGSRSGSR